MKKSVSIVKMLGPFRHCPHMKYLNHAALALTNTSLEIFNGIGVLRYYSDKKGSGSGCCKDVAQTAGMKVEPWPKPDQSPQSWRPECQLGVQPPNYDPYRIKVPETVVPPLPPCNVKRTHVLNTSSDQQNQQDQQQHYQPHHQQSFQQGYGYQHQQQVYGEEETKDPGFLGRLKGFFGRLKGKKDGHGDSMTTGNRNINWLYR